MKRSWRRRRPKSGKRSSRKNEKKPKPEPTSNTPGSRLTLSRILSMDISSLVQPSTSCSAPSVETGAKSETGSVAAAGSRCRSRRLRRPRKHRRTIVHSEKSAVTGPAVGRRFRGSSSSSNEDMEFDGITLFSIPALKYQTFSNLAWRLPKRIRFCRVVSTEELPSLLYQKLFASARHST